MSGRLFYAALLAAVALKLVLVSDLAVLIQHNPQDDGLYSVRAYHLLTDGGFGPYDARTLVKLPGISFWLAAERLVGLPYLPTMNVLYILAGCYFLAGALQCGVSRKLALAAFVVYLFNPATMGGEWIRVMREPLSTGLLTVLFASVLFMLRRLESGRAAWGHLGVFSCVFAFLLLLREEDVLLYLVLAMVAAAGWWIALRAAASSRPSRAFLVSAVAVPLGLAIATNAAARQFMERQYGLPLLHDYSEGEFPKLLAAIRSIESKKDNRYVMVTRERLAKLVVEVPRLAPVINRLPPPGPRTASCLLYKVCSETANGWMPFWLKDAAQEAGLTPTLSKGQEFFRAARADIERACAEGRLNCASKGNGFLPPFELRWTRAYLQELATLLAMTAAPDPFIHGFERHEMDAAFDHMVRFVTKTEHQPTQPQDAGSRQAWREAVAGVYRFLAPGLVLLAGLAFAVRLTLWQRQPPSALTLTMGIFVSYVLVRLAALSYASVYMGRFDYRILYATHSLLLLVGLFLVFEALYAMRAARVPRMAHE